MIIKNILQIKKKLHLIIFHSKGFFLNIIFFKSGAQYAAKRKKSSSWFVAILCFSFNGAKNYAYSHYHRERRSSLEKKFSF